MEKFFTNKKIWKMLIVAILVIMAVQVIVPTTVVFAEEEASDEAQDGDNVLYKGILMRPILSFLVSTGDAVMNLLHSQVMGQENCLQPIGMTEETSMFWAILGGIVAGILILAILSLRCGLVIIFSCRSFFY